MLDKKTEIYEINSVEDWEDLPLRGFYKDQLKYSGVEIEINAEFKDGTNKKFIFINNMDDDIE